MRTALLLGVLVLGPSLLPEARGQMLYREAQRAYEYALARRAAGYVPPAAFKSLGPYTKVNVTLPATLTGSGYPEPIAIMEPFGLDLQGPALPLIVVWNGYGKSANSFFMMSDIPDEANLRGWLLVAVTGVDDKGLGWLKGQQNVDAVIQHMIANYPVDEDRIYMVGWSAGGGAAVSYAARHLDPAQPMIAAVGTNAGSYDLVDAYWQEFETGDLPCNPQNPTTSYTCINHFLFEGPPGGATLFNYQRTQSETFDAALQAVDDGSSQLRNLRHVPVHHVYASDDTIPYLPAQNALFAQFLAQKGASISSQVVSGQVPSHTWDIMDAQELLDFFAPKVVERSPGLLDVAIDRDATYYWAKVSQRTPGSFSSLVANADPATNDLRVIAAHNLWRFELTPPASLFDANRDFTLGFSNVDPAFSTLYVGGVLEEPTYVLKDDSIYTFWTYNAAQQWLRFDLPGGGEVHELEVRFDDYSATLAGATSLPLPGLLPVTLQAATPGQDFLWMIGFAEGDLPIALVDPGDDRHVLVGMSPLPIFLFGKLGPAGTFALTLPIPSNGALLGQTLRQQALTFPGTTSVVDQMTPRLDTFLGLGGG